jgi:hypothetical protein
MDDDSKSVPESLLPYERWVDHALRQVVSQAVEYVSRSGMPGGHHFYLTFRTTYPGVEIPSRVLAQYPKEITIVLQNQFWDLSFDKETQTIRVGLSFGGVPAKLAIPLDSVVEFADPYIRYGLRFQPREDAPPPPRKAIVAAPPAPAPVPSGPGQIVSLDAFRRGSPKD